MAEMSPLRRRMIEDMTVRNLSPATQRSAILPSCGCEVQSIFRPLAGPARPGGRPCLPGPFGLDRHFVAGTEPDGLRAAVHLWRRARARGDPRAHPLRARAAQAGSSFFVGDSLRDLHWIMAKLK
jgi:hypothetical protein